MSRFQKFLFRMSGGLSPRRQPVRARRFIRPLFPRLAACVLAAAWPAEAQKFDEAEALPHTVVGRRLEEIGRFADEADPNSVKFGRAALTEARRAAELREPLKTPEQKQAEAAARQAILDPEGFRRAREAAEAKPKTPAEMAAREREQREREAALRAILDPTAAIREKDRDPVWQKRRAIAEESILRPREFNALVDRHKNAALQEKEADVIRAFVDPKGFLEERERLRKTGSRTPAKGEALPVEEKPREDKPKDEKPRGKEKGQEGGGR